MITETQLRNAVFYNPDKDNLLTAAEWQLVSSLNVYYERDEFDGSLESARECLTLAGYEFENAHTKPVDN